MLAAVATDAQKYYGAYWYAANVVPNPFADWKPHPPPWQMTATSIPSPGTGSRAKTSSAGSTPRCMAASPDDLGGRGASAGAPA